MRRAEARDLAYCAHDMLYLDANHRYNGPDGAGIEEAAKEVAHRGERKRVTSLIVVMTCFT